MKKILILLAFLFAIVGLTGLTAANAITLDSDSAELCATDTGLFIFSVTNEENFENSYTVSFSDTAGRWAIAAPAGFNLKQGRTQQVYVYVTPSISANPGEYNLKITLNSMAGTESVFASVTVKDCHSASLETDSSELDVCSATEAVYPLILKNTGKYTENFILSVTGVPAQWTVLSEELVRLEAGQTKNIVVHSTPPADQTGNFALTVTAASQNSRALAALDLDLTSKGCYGFSAAADANYLSFCENHEAKIPLAIENLGSVDNTYKISVEGPAWSTIENAELAVSAGQAEYTNVVLFPAYGVAGDFNINVIVKPETGDEQEQIIMANVRNCHSTSLKLATNEDSICPLTSKAYAVSLVNTGEFAERYSVTATGATFAKLDESFIELEPGNSTEFNLIVEPKDTISGANTIIVRAEAQDPSHAASTSELKLNVAPMTSCFGVQATAAITKVHVSAGEPAVVPIIIENKGLENSTYNIDVSGNGAQFVQLNPASLELDGKNAKTIYAYVAVPEQTAEDTYKVTVSARIADGTVSSTTSFDIILGAGEEETAEQTNITANTPKERLIAIKDKIVAYFKAAAEKIKSIKPPALKAPELKMPELNIPTLGGEEDEEQAANETAEEANETNETIWQTNETVFNESNETEENITVTEEIQEENVTITEENATATEEEIPAEYLSPELAEKFNLTTGEGAEEQEAEEQNGTEAAEESGAPATGLAAIRQKLSGFESPKLEMPELSWPAMPSLAFITDFLTENTYYNIPNWLFIIAVIIIIAAFSYIARKKGFAKKFNDFLEEDDAEAKASEGKKESKPAAQEILDEVDKEESNKPEDKKEKPKRKARKK